MHAKHETSSDSSSLLRSATILHAQALNALELPMQARSLLRLVLGLNHAQDQDSTTILHATLAQSEVFICTSSNFPIEHCNISSAVYHARQGIPLDLYYNKSETRIIKRKQKNNELIPVGEHNEILWSNILKRRLDDRRQRTHIVPLIQKIRHDVHQFKYLLQDPSLSIEKHANLEQASASYLHLLSILIQVTNENTNMTLAWETVDRRLRQELNYNDKLNVQKFYSKILHLPYPTIKKYQSALREDINIQQAINDYKKKGIVIIDSALTQYMLLSLQDFAASATIFHDPRNGYLGGYASGGMISEITMLLAHEISQQFSQIMEGENLVQMWMYKYDAAANSHQNKKESGIALHADDAYININIWLTKTQTKVVHVDRQQTDDGGGGLLIYPHLRAKKEDPFVLFNTKGSMRIHVDAETRSTDGNGNDGGKDLDVVQIPHSTNRMVIFDSSMYHQSDGGMDFGTGYEEQRINLTLLFGKRKKRTK